MNIQDLKNKPFELLTLEEKNELNVHYLYEISKRGLKARAYMRFYLMLFFLATAGVFASYFGDLQYCDKPLVYVGIMLFSSSVYNRNKRTLLFLGRIYEMLASNCTYEQK